MKNLKMWINTILVWAFEVAVFVVASIMCFKKIKIQPEWVAVAGLIIGGISVTKAIKKSGEQKAKVTEKENFRWVNKNGQPTVREEQMLGKK